MLISIMKHGFVGKDATNIFIGRRLRNSVENSVSSQYTFNEKWRLILLSVIIFRSCLQTILYVKR